MLRQRTVPNFYWVYRVCSVNQNSQTVRSCLIISNSTDLVLLIKTRNFHKRHFLTSPGGTLGSSTVTKYAGIRWPHQSCLEMHQSLNNKKTVTIKKKHCVKIPKIPKAVVYATQAVQYFSKRECLAQNPPLLLVGHKTPRGPLPVNFFRLVVWFTRSDLPLFLKTKCILHFTVYKLT